MNTKLVESLAQIIQSLTPEEQALLEEKIKFQQGVKLESMGETKKRPFYEITSSEERIRALREWTESHRADTPLLSDQAVSRRGIYEED